MVCVSRDSRTPRRRPKVAFDGEKRRMLAPLTFDIRDDALSIIIPDAAKEKPTKGEVIAVGEGKFIDATGGVRAPKVKVGDKVIYGQYSGSAYKQDGVEYKIIKEDDVLAILA